MHKSSEDWSFPFPRQSYLKGFGVGYAERGVAVEDGDANIDSGDLAVEIFAMSL